MEDNMKVAVLISCTDHYTDRMYLFADFLKEQGYQIQYVASDFHHVRKEPFICSVEGAKQVHVRPYQKNLSLSRILSHRDFARGVYRFLEAMPQEPALIVAEIPPNFLATYMARYKRRHPNVKLLMDMFDLWPETFPSGKIKKLLAPVFSVWAALRNRGLPFADLVTTECVMYQQVLEPHLKRCETQTVYLCRSAIEVVPQAPSMETLSVCYLGSINNIIDIDGICALLQKCVQHKPVKLHIIGDGENCDRFIRMAQNVGAQVEFHGRIYDREEQQRIFDTCAFGINMMKSSVCIGLTMKSLDYFAAGLPILNSLGGDTYTFVEQYEIGRNVSAETAETVAAAITSVTPEENLKMRQETLQVFRKYFTVENCKVALQTGLAKIDA